MRIWFHFRVRLSPLRPAPSSLSSPSCPRVPPHHTVPQSPKAPTAAITNPQIHSGGVVRVAATPLPVSDSVGGIPPLLQASFVLPGPLSPAEGAWGHAWSLDASLDTTPHVINFSRLSLSLSLSLSPPPAGERGKLTPSHHQQRRLAESLNEVVIVTTTRWGTRPQIPPPRPPPAPRGPSLPPLSP
ncbi:hypothetical protein O3P69_017559 [Scylla paramamosain]|uniref:Uncharacterized protein n=1 Tax=Scylla paramamosain TaxID=85552 RepID=A0AAW0TWG7_SCYPA